MKYTELRKVRITIQEDFSGDDNTVFEGRFHEWGTELGVSKERITVAIIEDSEGRIHTVLPSEVQFLDTQSD